MTNGQTRMGRVLHRHSAALLLLMVVESRSTSVTSRPSKPRKTMRQFGGHADGPVIGQIAPQAMQPETRQVRCRRAPTLRRDGPGHVRSWSAHAEPVKPADRRPSRTWAPEARVTKAKNHMRSCHLSPKRQYLPRDTLATARGAICGAAPHRHVLRGRSPRVAVHSLDHGAVLGARGEGDEGSDRGERFKSAGYPGRQPASTARCFTRA